MFDPLFQVLPHTKDVLRWELHYSLVRLAVDDMDYHSMRSTIECICEFTVATEHIRLVERMDCPYDPLPLSGISRRNCSA